LERLVLAHSPRFQAILDAASKRFEAGNGIPHEEFWKEAERRQATTRPKRERVKTA
jgi:hypothetical protein